MYSEFSLESHNLALIRGERLLFKQCDFEITNGQVIQIRGPNGAGKTSLLRVLCGILEPDEGDVVWQSEPLRHVRESFYSQLMYLGHQIGIKQHLSVLENLKFYSALRNATAMMSFQSAIEAVGLHGFDNELAAHLSQGQKRRVSLARLLIEPAALWVLDEPFVALDVEGQAWLASLIEAHLKNSGSVIFTSHQTVDLNVKVDILEVGAANFD